MVTAIYVYDFTVKHGYKEILGTYGFILLYLKFVISIYIMNS